MLGNTIKELRKKKGVTQEELANNIFVSRSLVAKFETNAAFPSKEALEKIAEYFDVPVSSLEESKAAIETNEKQKPKTMFLIAILAISVLILILIFVPFIKGQRYIYPIEPGANQPKREYFFTSIFNSNYEHNNPMGFISLFLIITTIALSSISLAMKEKKYSKALRITTYAVFFVSLVIFVISLFSCLGSTSLLRLA